MAFMVFGATCVLLLMLCVCHCLIMMMWKVAAAWSTFSAIYFKIHCAAGWVSSVEWYDKQIENGPSAHLTCFYWRPPQFELKWQWKSTFLSWIKTQVHDVPFLFATVTSVVHGLVVWTSGTKLKLGTVPRLDWIERESRDNASLRTILIPDTLTLALLATR